MCRGLRRSTGKLRFFGCKAIVSSFNFAIVIVDKTCSFSLLFLLELSCRGIFRLAEVIERRSMANLVLQLMIDLRVFFFMNLYLSHCMCFHC